MKKIRAFIPLLKWFDVEFAEKNLKSNTIDWSRTIPFVVLHLGCLAVFWVGASLSAIIAAILLYFIRMFAITGFYHRYFSHRSFKTNRFWQFIFALLAASAAQRGPLWWASHHRHHHRYSDAVQDRHSPRHHGFIWSHMGWFFASENFVTDYKLVADLVKYPELRWLNRFDLVVPLLLAVSLFLAGYFLQQYFPELHTNGWQFLVWGFFISTVLVFHATCSINSLAHQWGKRPFNTADESRNNFWLALITLGEGWHNNHHFYPGSARQGFYWWQIDITFYLLCLLSYTHVIHGLRPNPSKLRTEK
ncbi:acyl-CoA desaturase [Legionella donaldsonii]|uniref:acyl-CoA desaturase n=1 Tax=Legionella donaldsonii TaxID=45060 RepID=UPI00399C92BB